MAEPQPLTAADIDSILGLVDQFLEDWEASDREQPAADRDPTLPLRRAEWLRVRPLLLAAPQLAQLLQRAADDWLPGDSNFRAEVSNVLDSVAAHRNHDAAGDALAISVTITEETWRAVLLEGLEPGAHWRPEIMIDTPEMDHTDGYYWHDCEAHDPASGPFATLDLMLEDILSTQILDAARLTRHCGLDRWTAAAVLAYETAANMKHQKQRDTVPDDATT